MATQPFQREIPLMPSIKAEPDDEELPLPEHVSVVTVKKEEIEECAVGSVGEDPLASEADSQDSLHVEEEPLEFKEEPRSPSPEEPFRHGVEGKEASAAGRQTALEGSPHEGTRQAAPEISRSCAEPQETRSAATRGHRALSAQHGERGTWNLLSCEESHQCDMCGKKFSTKGTLKTHSLLHTESEVTLNDGIRTRWPKMQDCADSEPVSCDVSSQDDTTAIPSMNLMEIHRSKNKEKKEKKKAIMSSFMENSDLPLIQNGSKKPGIEDADDDTEDLLQAIAHLKKELKLEKKESERLRNSHDVKLAELKTFFAIEFEKINSKLDSFATLNSRLSVLETQLADMKELINNHQSNSNVASTSTGFSSLSEEKVDLGEGVLCSRICYENLGRVMDSHSDWSLTLLKGVFQEEAPQMRLRCSQKSGHKKFSEQFLNVAKYHHRLWLERLTIKMPDGSITPKYSPAEIEGFVSRLPSYLSERAEALSGPRGLAGKIREMKRTGQDPTALEDAMKERQAARTGHPKRKYVRRGTVIPIQSQTPAPPQQPPPTLPPAEQRRPLHQVPYTNEGYGIPGLEPLGHSAQLASGNYSESDTNRIQSEDHKMMII